MKRCLFLFAWLLAAGFVQGQQVNPAADTPTKYSNQDLVLIALAAFALLIAMYFLFRRKRKG